jgi:class 3 adenylate cyclase
MTQDKTLEEWAGGPMKTLALVFTDIVGSTELGRKLGDETWVDLLMNHFERARYLIDAFDGYEIKLIGDAVMVAFHTATDAVRFAIAFFLDTGAPQIFLRVGVHFGQMRIVDNDLYGLAVNLTSRVQHVGEGHLGIMISDPAKKDVQSEIGTSSTEMRFTENKCALRGFGPQIVWRVGTPEFRQKVAEYRKANQPPALPPIPVPRSFAPPPQNKGLPGVSGLIPPRPIKKDEGDKK